MRNAHFAIEMRTRISDDGTKSGEIDALASRIWSNERLCDIQHTITKPIQAPPQDPSSFTMLELQPPQRFSNKMVA